MKILYYCAIILLLTPIDILAQIQQGGTPSLLGLLEFKSSVQVETYTMQSMNVEKLIKKSANKLPVRYAVLEDVKVNIKEDGTKYTINNGTAWIYHIKATDALSINLLFDKFNIPTGAKMFVYNNKENILGAFTSNNNKDGGVFAVRDLIGNELYIEYFEPDTASFSGVLTLSKIGQAFKGISGVNTTSNTNETLVDINCKEGDKGQLLKHAVAKMTFSGYLCTGALINNTRNDGVPYFLTAHHCISEDELAKTLITYFNYEREGCGEGDSSSIYTLSGAKLKSTYKETDASLLLLSETPLASYQPYYAGWNAKSDSIISSGVGIHHPKGLTKKISVDYSEIINHPYIIYWDVGVESSPSTHWHVTYNVGETKGGSSGSPLFDNNNRIIGQLHGGDDIDNFYGKLSKSWTLSSSSSELLKTYLDPTGTGTQILDGYYPSSNNVDAFPYTDITNVCAETPVTLKDGSLFGANSWEWSISPSTFSYAEGTSSTSQNPVVIFHAEGNYTIGLSVSNGVTSEEQVRNDYITVGGLDVTIFPTIHSGRCYANQEQLVFKANGADGFQYELVKGDELWEIDDKLSNNDSLVIRLKTGAVVDTTFDIEVLVTGRQGVCEQTATGILKLYYQSNNDIENAFALTVGDNGPFINSCADAQENEPYPTIGNCSTDGEWCDCSNKEIPYVNNSLWFTFKGTETGMVTIDCPGFDNQIAIYEAASASDIMSGDASKYNIIAAIDDYYNIDGKFAAKLFNVNVEAGKTYWLQVDGSMCGTTGVFQVKLTNEYVSSTYTYKANNDIKISPNPVNGYFEISSGNREIIKARLYSLEGKLLNDYQFPKGNRGVVNAYLPEYLKRGLYILQVTDENHIYSLKLMVDK